MFFALKSIVTRVHTTGRDAHAHITKNSCKKNVNSESLGYIYVCSSRSKVLSHALYYRPRLTHPPVEQQKEVLEGLGNEVAVHAIV